MNDFTYAHNNTSGGERRTKTASFNRPKLAKEISDIRQNAFLREIPVSSDETLCFLQTIVAAKRPKRILELGTAVGVSGSVMLTAFDKASLVTVEKNEEFFFEAKANFKALGLDARCELILGDGGEVIKELDGEFDLIFVDSAKVQYVKYLKRLIELTKVGGIILADDVLLYGYLTGEAEVPKKRKMLVEHIREYIDLVTSLKELSTTILDIGDGVAMSVRIK